MNKEAGQDPVMSCDIEIPLKGMQQIFKKHCHIILVFTSTFLQKHKIYSKLLEHALRVIQVKVFEYIRGM